MTARGTRMKLLTIVLWFGLQVLAGRPSHAEDLPDPDAAAAAQARVTQEKVNGLIAQLRSLVEQEVPVTEPGTWAIATDLRQLGPAGMRALAEEVSRHEELLPLLDFARRGYVGDRALELGKALLPKLAASLPGGRWVVKPIQCEESLAAFFPGYHFYFLAREFDEAPRLVLFLRPDYEAAAYQLGEEHKDGDTALTQEIARASVRLRSSEEASQFALLWLVLALGNEDFVPVKTDHRDQTHY